MSPGPAPICRTRTIIASGSAFSTRFVAPISITMTRRSGWCHSQVMPSAISANRFRRDPSL